LDDLYNSGTSYWSAYAFDLTGSLVSPAIFIPSHSGVYDLADYSRFGTWKDAYFMTFDFIDESAGGTIDGFAVCKLDSADMSQGNKANSATCYAYYPPAVPPMIHTLLPADMETAGYASGTQGEYFLATVNPGTDGHPCTSSTGCTSTSLAFWTWSGTSTGITTENAPTTVTVSTFTPGCYDISDPGNTVCVQQPGTTNTVDSVGDRLMSPLAYRYISPCEEGRASYTSCEYMAVTQTVNEFSGAPPTGIRYYTLAGPVSPSTSPTLVYQGDVYDSSDSLYYWMGSNAIDKNEDVGYTFSVGNGSSTGCSGSPCLSKHLRGQVGRRKQISEPSKACEPDQGLLPTYGNHHWGEYVSTSIDPGDDLTFWSVGQYQASTNGNEATCHGKDVADGCSTADYSGCNWSTSAFTCKEGSGFCP